MDGHPMTKRSKLMMMEEERKKETSCIHVKMLDIQTYRGGARG